MFILLCFFRGDMWLPAHAAIGCILGRKTSLDTWWCVAGSI